jgi:hypothetical protein|tara:strand:- start:405 stop:578 length:174 start_codon:yes stop_codon:yes gene_type:complete
MYNSVGFLGFSILHEEEEVETITSQQVRDAIIMRLASIDDQELLECVGLNDTYNEED